MKLKKETRIILCHSLDVSGGYWFRSVFSFLLFTLLCRHVFLRWTGIKTGGNLEICVCKTTEGQVLLKLAYLQTNRYQCRGYPWSQCAQAWNRVSVAKGVPEAAMPTCININCGSPFLIWREVAYWCIFNDFAKPSPSLHEIFPLPKHIVSLVVHSSLVKWPKLATLYIWLACQFMSWCGHQLLFYETWLTCEKWK